MARDEKSSATRHSQFTSKTRMRPFSVMTAGAAWYDGMQTVHALANVKAAPVGAI